MSDFTQFDTTLKIQYHHLVSKIKNKPHWEVLEAFEYYTDVLGTRCWIRVPEGFISDGASAPRILQWWIRPMDKHGQATVLHDYLLNYPRVRFKRYRDMEYWETDDDVMVPISIQEADQIFLEAMTVLEVNVIQRYVMYYGVRFWAWLKNKT